MSVKNKAQICAVMGSSGSGKSLFIKGELNRLKPRRLIVWDCLGEYVSYGNTCAAVIGLLDLARAKEFRLIFRPSGDPAQAKKQFGMVCRIAYAAGNLTLIAEELAFVTSPSFAPAGWSECTLKGRHRGLVIYGASQRPASIDKHFFGNATTIRTGRLNFERDIKTLSDVLQVPAPQIRGLQPLEYLQRDMQTGKNIGGKLQIPKK